jgi:hypothetical protein
VADEDAAEDIVQSTLIKAGTPQSIQHWLLPDPSGEGRQVAQRANPHEESRLTWFAAARSTLIRD